MEKIYPHYFRNHCSDGNKDLSLEHYPFVFWEGKSMKEDDRLVTLARRVKALEERISLETIYDIIRSGHNLFIGGLGLSHEEVRETIAKALEQENMEYDTPEEMCLLRWNSAKNHIDRITKETEALQEKINKLREESQKWEKEALTFAHAHKTLLAKQTSAPRKDLEENAKFVEVRAE